MKSEMKYSGLTMPKLIVFDLDDTIWYPEMYMLAGSPFQRDPETRKVYDREKEHVYLHPEAKEILHLISHREEFKDTKIAFASRTTYPEYAEECLRLLEVHFDHETREGISLQQIVHHVEIEDSSKKAHFRKLSRKTGLDFSEMLFFDNEYRNIRDVAAMGVISVYTPDGLLWEHFHEGLRIFNGQN